MNKNTWKKRGRNRIRIIELLKSSGLVYEPFTADYVHVRIYVQDIRIDFWPGTERFKILFSDGSYDHTDRHGWDELLNYIDQIKKSDRSVPKLEPDASVPDLKSDRSVPDLIDHEIDQPKPDLSGRRARCMFYGQSTHAETCRCFDCKKGFPKACMCESDSSEGLPFFVYKPDQPFDEYYCFCRGFDNLPIIEQMNK